MTAADAQNGAVRGRNGSGGPDSSSGADGAPVSPSRLDEIAGRLEAATPGPWTVDVQGPDWARVTTPSGGALGCGDAVGDASFFTRDADLIAHAPADLAALLGVVRTVAELADDLAASPAVGGSSAEQWEFDTRRQVATEIRAALAALTGTTKGETDAS